MITKTRKPLGFIDNVFIEREEKQFEGSIKYSFYYNDVPIRHLIPDSKLALKLASYNLIEKDLNSAYASIKYLIELQEELSVEELRGLGNHDNRNFVISKSLHQAATVTYCKCFANSAGGKKKSNATVRGVKLEKKMIASFPLAERNAHDVLMNTRNEYIAHGGATGLEQSLTLVLLTPENKIASDILCLEAHAGGFDTQFYNTVLSLIDNLKKSLQVMQDKKRKVINEGYLSKLKAEEIDRLATYSSTVQLAE